MYPVLLSWGPIVVPSWHAFYVLGAFAAYVLLCWLARCYVPTMARQHLARLFAVAYVAGYVGARLLSILIEEPEVQGPAATLAALLTFGPMTFYGGAICAFAAGQIYIVKHRLPWADLFDLTIPAGLFGLVLGRIGCFLNGDDFGQAAPLAADGSAPNWAVVFPNLADGIPRWPVQLMEAGAVLLLVICCCAFFRRLRTKIAPGAVGYAAVVGYANIRFFLEFLRDDFRGSVLGTWVSTSQFISIVILLVAGLAAPLWLRQAAKQRSAPSPAP